MATESIEFSTAQGIAIGRELAGMQGQPVETVCIEARTVAECAKAGIPAEAVVVMDVEEEADLFYVMPDGRVGDIG